MRTTSVLTRVNSTQRSRKVARNGSVTARRGTAWPSARSHCEPYESGGRQLAWRYVCARSNSSRAILRAS